MKDGPNNPKMPGSVDEAARMLLSDFLVQQLQDLASRSEYEFEKLCRALTPYVNHTFKITQGNEVLVTACQKYYRNNCDDPARIIIERARDMLENFSGLFVLT